MASGFNGFFVVASNPVDIISYHIMKLSGLPKNQVIGTGTSIDTIRLKTILSSYLNDIDPRDIRLCFRRTWRFTNGTMVMQK
ncbi:MAG: lactate/malate family dehydrogenase [Thomasclavelia ramosa]